MAKIQPRYAGLDDSGKPPSRLRTPKERVVTHAFVGKFGKLATNEVIEALEAIGKNSKWFADQFQERYNESSNYDKIRLLRMLLDLLKQSEGTTVRVEGTDEASTDELRKRKQELIAAIAAEKETLASN